MLVLQQKTCKLFYLLFLKLVYIMCLYNFKLHLSKFILLNTGSI
nr:MAG TPA_asm: hypothetical protein [Caudoviricetes sp.]